MSAIGSLCSGYGGLDVALDGDVLWHAEVEPAASRILEHHWPGVPNLGDLTTVDWANIEPVDWLTAGYPCQPFSLAGNRKGTDDERHIWPFIAAAVGVLRPRHLLLENVANHLRLGFDVVLADLARLGYDARWGVVRAAEAGAPHGRARLFVVASDTNGQRINGRRVHGPGQRWRPEPAHRGDTAADALCSRLRKHPGGTPPEEARTHAGDQPAGDCGSRTAGDRWPAAADAPRFGWGEGRSESTGRGWGSAVVLGRAPAPDADGDGRACLRRVGPGERDADRRDREDVAWGAYEPAIRRWERTTGRPAPRPTEPGRNGPRLSARFVEWLMGLPDGWVTDVPGLTRTQMLKALGNGVVPQQAALALRLLTEHEVAA